MVSTPISARMPSAWLCRACEEVASGGFVLPGVVGIISNLLRIVTYQGLIVTIASSVVIEEATMESSQRAGHPSRIQVSGPLAPFAAGWRAELAARGFARHSVLAHAQLMAHLSGWMMAAGHDAGSLTGEVVGGYLEARRAAGYRARSGGQALVPLLGYTRGRGVVSLRAALPGRPAGVL